MSDQPITVTVTLTKVPQPGQAAVSANPSVIKVKPGQLIRFTRVSTAGTLRITFPDRQFFETGNPEFAEKGMFHEDDGDVRVKAITRPTELVCEWLDAEGNLKAQSEPSAGIRVEPAPDEPEHPHGKG